MRIFHIIIKPKIQFFVVRTLFANWKKRWNVLHVRTRTTLYVRQNCQKPWRSNYLRKNCLFFILQISSQNIERCTLQRRGICFKPISFMKNPAGIFHTFPNDYFILNYPLPIRSSNRSKTRREVNKQTNKVQSVSLIYITIARWLFLSQFWPLL
jgi:hypothetical protein